MRNLNVLQPVLNKSAPRKVVGLWRAAEVNIAADADTSIRIAKFSFANRLWIVVPLLITLSAGSGTAAETDFDQHIAPIFISHCLECHAGDEPQGGLSLAEAKLAEQGGDSGEVIVPRNAVASLLWGKISADEMPPEHPLNEADKATIRNWIDEGAAWGTSPIDVFAVTTSTRAGRDWWSLQPLKNVAPPSLEASGWVRNDIDAFVMKRLQDAGLHPSPETDRRTLIRRLYFDLIGLPPTPEQVAAFVADPSQDAYENVVDELLASPHYGERWARHWLDIVRFGESNGFEYDQPRDNAWHYRNWVIAAFNQDMPYDEFVRLQLAGDVLFPDDIHAAAATGFLVAGPHNTTLPDNAAMKMTMAQDELEDLVGIVGQTFLGLTANCARCHDHKFDPISQKEYYQFAATLTGVTHGEREFPVALPDEQQQRLAELETRVRDVQDDAERKAVQDEIDSLKNSQTLPLYTCVSKDPGITRLLRRGDVSSPAEDVAPRGLSAVAGGSPDFRLPTDARDADRRRHLADSVTHGNNPLFARVIVNRLWQYHFGQGMVTTPSDFGFNGGRPSHPELLDWLALSLRASGFRLKPLHRLIVTSAAYRQSSALNADAAAVDADNRWLWRKSPLRLEAEEIRDAILVATGLLNRDIGGRGYRDVRHFEFKGSNFYESIDESGPETLRRTVYRFTSRGGRNPFLDTFDCPDPSATSPKRASTTTPLQALSLMNNALVLQMSDHFAARTQREAGTSAADKIRLVYEIAYSRTAEPDEIARGRRFVEAYGLASFCRVVLNSNEFLYVR